MVAETMSPNLMVKQKSDYADKSAHFWNKMARKYAKNKIGDMKGYERSITRTQDFLSRDQHVLEIGCGAGTTALRHAPHVAHITGTDISPEMVAISNEKIADNGPLNAEFVVTSAEELPFANESFEVAMAHNLLHLVGDTEQSLAAAHRVLKPGGFFISKTPCLGEMNALMRFAILPVMKRIYSVPKLNTFTMDSLEEAHVNAGFKIEAIEFHGTKGKDTRPFIVARKA